MASNGGDTKNLREENMHLRHRNDWLLISDEAIAYLTGHYIPIAIHYEHVILDIHMK